MTKIIKTTCSTCGPCCEVDAYVKDGKLIGVEGARNTPMQTGGLCAKVLRRRSMCITRTVSCIR